MRSFLIMAALVLGCDNQHGARATAEAQARTIRWALLTPGDPEILRCASTWTEIDDSSLQRWFQQGAVHDAHARDPWGHRFSTRCEHDETFVASPGYDGKLDTADDAIVPR